MPPASNANFAWMQHMIWHLAPEGRMGMVLANGSLSTQTNGEGEIRKRIVDDDLVDCIISLPSQLFYTTGISVCLWFLNKKKTRPGETLFIEAKGLGADVSRRLRELSEDDIELLANIYRSYSAGTLTPEKGFYAVADIEEISKRDYLLTPARYVGYRERDNDGEPFEEKMKRLSLELDSLFTKSNELQVNIKDNLRKMGFLKG